MERIPSIESSAQKTFPQTKNINSQTYETSDFEVLTDYLFESAEIVILQGCCNWGDNDNQEIQIEDTTNMRHFLSVKQLRDRLFNSVNRPQLWIAWDLQSTKFILYLMGEGVIPNAIAVANERIPLVTIQRFAESFLYFLGVYNDEETALREARNRLTNQERIQDIRYFTNQLRIDATQKPQLVLQVNQIADDFYSIELSLLRTGLFGSNEVHIDHLVIPAEQQTVISTTVQGLFYENIVRLQQVLANFGQKNAISLGLRILRHFNAFSWEHLVLTSLHAVGLPTNMHPYVYHHVVNERYWKQRGPVQGSPLRILFVLDRPDHEFAGNFQKLVLSPEGYQRLLRWTQLLQRFMPTVVQLTVLDQSAGHPMTPDILVDTLQQGFDIVYWPITVRQAGNMSSFIVFMQPEYYHSEEYTRTLRSLINPPRLWLLAGEETELLAQELIKEGLAGAVVGVRGFADPDQLQPLFRRLTAEVLRSGRVDVARTRMRQAFSEQEAADQIVVWSTEDGLDVIDLDTVAQYRSLLEVIAQGESNTEEAAL